MKVDYSKLTTRDAIEQGLAASPNITQKKLSAMTGKNHKSVSALLATMKKAGAIKATMIDGEKFAVYALTGKPFIAPKPAAKPAEKPAAKAAAMPKIKSLLPSLNDNTPPKKNGTVKNIVKAVVKHRISGKPVVSRALLAEPVKTGNGQIDSMIEEIADALAMQIASRLEHKLAVRLASLKIV